MIHLARTVVYDRHISSRTTRASTRTLRALAAIGMAAVVAACSSSAAPAASQSVLASTVAPATAAPTPTAPPTVAATATPLPSATDTAAPSDVSATGVPIGLDPCKLVTAQEASQLAGASYTVGKEETTSGNARVCWYGANTLNVFEVLVAQAPDAATVQTEKAQALAKLQASAGSNPIKVTPVTGVGDDAAFLALTETISGQTLNGSGIYVLKGLVFFAIVDLVLGKPAPANSAMQAQAQTVIGRLP